MSASPDRAFCMSSGNSLVHGKDNPLDCRGSADRGCQEPLQPLGITKIRVGPKQTLILHDLYSTRDLTDCEERESD